VRRHDATRRCAATTPLGGCAATTPLGGCAAKTPRRREETRWTCLDRRSDLEALHDFNDPYVEPDIAPEIATDIALDIATDIAPDIARETLFEASLAPETSSPKP
jgi:hypothetical protein